VAVGSGVDGQDTPAATPVPFSVTCLVGAASLAATALLLTAWAGHYAAAPVDLVVASLAVLIAGSRTLRVSDLVGTVSIGSLVVLAALIHLGTPEACVVGALGGLAAMVLSPERHERPPAAMIFAVASLVITAWVAGHVFVLAGGRRDMFGIETLAVPAFVAATAYYIVNGALVTMVSHLTYRVSWRELLNTCLGPTVVAFYAGAGLAVLLHVAWQLSGAWVLIGGAPIAYVIHLTLSRRMSQQAAAPPPAR
jgi:hypothetical protein